MNFQRLNRISKTYLGRAVLADFLFGPLVSFGRRNSRLPKPVRRSAPQRARLRCLASPARLTHSPAWSLASSHASPRIASHALLQLLRAHAFRMPARCIRMHPRMHTRIPRDHPRLTPAHPRTLPHARAAWPRTCVRCPPATRCCCLPHLAPRAAWPLAHCAPRRLLPRTRVLVAPRLRTPHACCLLRG